MARSFDLDPVQELAVATVGDPGSRQFFLLARGPHEGQPTHATLSCEKFHIQGLVLRIQQLLEAQGMATGFDPAPVGKIPTPGEPDWRIGELGLGYHESRRLFVIVARELLENEEASESMEINLETSAGEAATARLWASPDRVRLFARQAEQVLSRGRPLCTYCGLPIDPSGHPCPASNGARPIL
ncbi:MAG TPA: DUF3090 family protein [Candidatus Dormibacteraeota bacterium]